MKKAKMKTSTSADTGVWTTGLCDLCGTPGGLGLCCTACCCPCWQFGLNAARFEPDEVVCGGNQLGACMAYIGLAAATPALSSLTGIDMRGMWIYLPVALQWQMRNKIRQKYGIKGHPLLDALTVCCCHPCALGQEARELAWRTGQR